jgi:integrase
MSIKMLRPGSRHGNKVYYARITGGGERVEVSTRTTNPRLAKRYAQEVERRLFERGGSERKTVAYAIDAFLAFKPRSKRDESRLLQIKSLIGGRQVAGIKQDDFDECARMLCHGKSGSTRNRDVYAPLQAVVRHSGVHIPLKRPKQSKPRHRSLTREQRDFMLKNCDDPDLKAWLCLMFFNACRTSEAIRLKWEDVDLDHGSARIDMTKTETEDWTPLHERTVAALANLPKDREKVLRWKQRSGPNWVLKKLLKRLGMKFNAHMGRHTFGDLFHEAGGSLRDLTEAGRWASPACAMRYTGKRVERVRKGIARL